MTDDSVENFRAVQPVFVTPWFWFCAAVLTLVCYKFAELIKSYVERQPSLFGVFEVVPVNVSQVSHSNGFPAPWVGRKTFQKQASAATYAIFGQVRRSYFGGMATTALTIPHNVIASVGSHTTSSVYNCKTSEFLACQVQLHMV